MICGFIDRPFVCQWHIFACLRDFLSVNACKIQYLTDFLSVSGTCLQSLTDNKSVKYSIVWMKAVKALQEAMTRIEKLEQENIALRARVTNLEGS